MSAIARKGASPYGVSMAAAIFRMFALVALMLMPLGMAGTPAVAQPVPADHAMMTMGHCDEQPGQDKAPLSKMDCTAMCTALPATDSPAPAPAVKPEAPRAIAIAALFIGVEPEIATPPPRRG